MKTVTKITTREDRPFAVWGTIMGSIVNGFQRSDYLACKEDLGGKPTTPACKTEQAGTEQKERGGFGDHIN